MPRKSKKLVIDLDQKTGMLIGALVQKGLVKLEHNNGLDFGETKLELTTDPDVRQITCHINGITVPVGALQICLLFPPFLRTPVLSAWQTRSSFQSGGSACRRWE